MGKKPNVRVLLIDEKGLALQMSWSAEKAGHDIKHFIRQTPKTEHIGRGLVNVVDSWEEHVEWSDFIILTDNTKYVQAADRMRAAGKIVLSATEESAKLELNRDHAMKVFKKHGIPIIDYKVFEDYDKAISYVKRENRRFVSKPDDDGDNKALSYVSKNAADMVYMLERWKGNDRLQGRFILQSFLPGTEMAVGAWIGPHGFVGPWCENWEHKKLMPGNMGPNTGEMGTVLRYVRSSKLANRVLKPLEDTLVATGHTGYIDVNCIIDDKGNPWPLEFTSRFGWPTFNIQTCLHAGETIQTLYDIATGKKSFDCQHDMVAIGALLAVPDFPYSHMTRKEVVGMPIYGLIPSLMEHIQLCEVKMEKRLPLMGPAGVIYGSTFATAGDYVMIVTATATTVSDARTRLIRRLERVSIPNSPFYRNDIGKSLKKSLEATQPHGYATKMIYRSKN